MSSSAPSGRRTDHLDLSVVAPLYNESQNVAPLVEWILEALATYPGRFEVILVDDGSRDDTWARVAAAAAADQPLDDQPPASADSLVVQQAWLQRIRDLVDEGRGDEALDSLQEFRRRYPDVALPDDLRRLAPAAAP